MNKEHQEKVKALRRGFTISVAAFEMQHSISKAFGYSGNKSSMHLLHLKAQEEINKEEPDIKVMDFLLALMEEAVEHQKQSTETMQKITEEHLERLGFTCVENEMYVNKKQWLLQVSDDHVDTSNGEIINRDGTWFDGIGTRNFPKNGEMVVNTLCRGNYVCRSVETVEDLQLLFLALTGDELKF